MRVESRREVSDAVIEMNATHGERVGRGVVEVVFAARRRAFPSLGDLAQTVWNRAERRKARVVETNLIHIEASRTDGELLSLILLGAEAPVGNGNLTASLGKKCTTQVLATLGR